MSSDSVIYLDHGATSWPKPPSVLESMSDFMGGVAANAGRSGHFASVKSSEMINDVRTRMAKFLGIADPSNFIFTKGTTEGLNLVLKGFLIEGDKVLISPMEHNSVMRVLAKLKREIGLQYETLPGDEFGRIDLERAGDFTGGDFKLLVVAHASNVNGVVQDIDALRQIFPDVPMLVDAAQTGGVLPIDIDETGIDFLACSSHKGLLGPAGIGGCYISPKYEIAPLIEGATGSFSDSIDHPNSRPSCYEAGTSNLHGIAGLRGALDYFDENELSGEHKRYLTSIMIEGIGDYPGVKIYSPKDGTALSLAFTIAGVSAVEIAAILEKDYDILCRPGLHCAPNAHKHLGTLPNGAVRLAPGYGNTQKEIVDAIRAVGVIAMETATKS